MYQPAGDRKAERRPAGYILRRGEIYDGAGRIRRDYGRHCAEGRETDWRLLWDDARVYQPAEPEIQEVIVFIYEK